MRNGNRKSIYFYCRTQWGKLNPFCCDMSKEITMEIFFKNFPLGIILIFNLAIENGCQHDCM